MDEAAAHLRPWVRWVDEERNTVEARRELIAEWEQHWRAGELVLMGIWCDGALAGGCSLAARDGGVVEVGYWLHPAFLGRGVATRAARLLTDTALALPGTTATLIRHDKANEASGAVARRLGYTLSGEQPNPVPAAADSGTDLVWQKPASRSH